MQQRPEWVSFRLGDLSPKFIRKRYGVREDLSPYHA